MNSKAISLQIFSGKHLDKRLILYQQYAAGLPLGIENVSQLFRKRSLAEGLRNQLDAGIKPAIMDDGVSCITRREQDFKVRTALSRLVRELTAIHPAG